MQKTLYLHIGTEKTGSTALQAVSGMNRAALTKHGIFYPRTPGERNHTRLTIFAADAANALDLRRLSRLFSEAAYESFKTNFAAELQSEIATNPCARICLSNEHLSSRLKSVVEIRRLEAIVRPLATSVKVVVYLRPQPEMFLSTYSTSIKAGRTKVLEAPKKDLHPRYNYDKMLSSWAEVFGEENVIVRIYDRDTLVGHDVVKDFFSILGYEPGPDIEIPSKPLNTRLSHRALCFLLEFNKYVPPLLEETANPERGDIADALEAISTEPGRGLAVPAAVLRGMAKTFQESNARVARRFLRRTDGKLFSEGKYEDNPEAAAFTVEHAVQIAAHLWRWQQRRLEEARREIARLQPKSTPSEKISRNPRGRDS
jgi:hypothetical protein